MFVQFDGDPWIHDRPRSNVEPSEEITFEISVYYVCMCRIWVYELTKAYLYPGILNQTDF